jgi:hypothetical protein
MPKCNAAAAVFVVRLLLGRVRRRRKGVSRLAVSMKKDTQRPRDYLEAEVAECVSHFIAEPVRMTCSFARYRAGTPNKAASPLHAP